jgi:MFS transporter, DHA3 family, macrolide efflux protein
MGPEMENTSSEWMDRRSWKLPFFAIWSGQAVSLFGSNVVQFSLIWWLTVETGSATVLAVASLAGIVPQIVLGPIAGAYVDRLDRRKVMMAADGLVAVVSLALAYSFFIGAIEIWQIYLALVLRSVGEGFHWAAFQASTSLMVPNRHLARIAGLNQTLNGLISIVGPPVGALLLNVLPLFGIMMVDVATALVAIVPLLFISIPQPKRKAAAPGSQPQSIWRDIRDGLSYIRGWPGLIYLIALAMVIKIALTPAFSLIPLLVSEHFEAGAAQLSLMESLFGIGVVVGGLSLSAWGGFKRKIHTILIGLVLLGVGLAILGLTPPGWFWLAVLSALVIGLTIPFIDGPIMAIVQGTVAPEMQGRVFTLMGSLISITSPIGLAIAGPVSDWAGLQVWFIIAALLCVTAGLVGFLMPSLVHIEENGVGHISADLDPEIPELGMTAGSFDQ